MFAFLQDIGPLELGIVLLILLLIFGPKRLPGLGRQLGTGMREFKDSITGKSGADDDADRPALAQAPPPDATLADEQQAAPRPAEPAP